MRISDVMTRDPVWCTPNCTAVQIARVMRDCDCGALPVIVSQTNHQVIGIITDRDLCLRVMCEGRHPSDVLVGECMTAEPVCCNRDDDVRRALVMMGTHRIRRVPITDHAGRLVGIVSLTDLLEYEAANAQDVAYILKRMDTTETRHMSARAA